MLSINKEKMPNWCKQVLSPLLANKLNSIGSGVRESTWLWFREPGKATLMRIRSTETKVKKIRVGKLGSASYSLSKFRVSHVQKSKRILASFMGLVGKKKAYEFSAQNTLLYWGGNAASHVIIWAFQWKFSVSHTIFFQFFSQQGNMVTHYKCLYLGLLG